ncbi:MAG: hypothetical protein IPJ17_02485 [Holophagales bacterium]|nr:MAG: hypothetical protein IPJ17_02485 [Holophagales bacterium]
MPALPHDRVLPCTPILALLLSAWSPPTHACDAPLCSAGSVVVRDRLGQTPEENVLKLYGAAVDPLRHRLYVAGILTPDLAILDTTTRRWIGNVATGESAEFRLKSLFADPERHALWVVDTSVDQVRRIDLGSGTVVGPVAFSGLGLGVVDRARGRLVLSSAQSPGVQAFDPATLAVAWSSSAYGPGTGPIVYDAGADELLVLDGASTAATRAIHRLRAADGAPLGDLLYTAVAGRRAAGLARDESSGRLFVATPGELLILEANGSRRALVPLPPGYELEGIALDEERGQLAVLTSALPASGEVASAAGRLFFFDAATGAPRGEVAVGRKPHRVVFDPDADAYYLPNADAGTVWRVDAATPGPAEALRLGDSLEGIALAGERLVLDSRLGGSYLTLYDPATGSATPFTSGTWPYPALTDRAGSRLFVLDFWDGTLSLFNLGTGSPQRTATIPTGLPRGTTDRLPDLVVDEARQRAFAAFPEHARIAVVDLAAGSAGTPLEVPGGQAGDTGGGPAQIELALDAARGVLYAFVRSAARLTAWSLDGTPHTLASATIPNLDLEAFERGADRRHLFVDEGRSVLWVGPHEIDASSLQPTGRRLPHGAQVLAVTADGAWTWSFGTEGSGASERTHAFRLDRSSLALEADVPLATRGTLAAVPVYDVAHDRLWVADQTTTTLARWDGSGSGGPDDPPVPCAASETTLCLGAGGRFAAEVAWRSHDGTTGVGHTRPQSTDTGTFWFFDAGNLELMVKVLDGRGINGHTWVYYGSLTDVEFTLTITDTETGAHRSYTNPRGQMASAADVEAFATE